MKAPTLVYEPETVKLRTGETIARLGDGGWEYHLPEARMRYVLGLNILFADRGFRWRMSYRGGKVYFGGMQQIHPGEWFTY